MGVTSGTAAHLATTWRGSVPEAVIRAHVAVVDADGGVIAGAGDPEALTTLRSCVKPLQALPFLRTAADEVRATSEEVAVVCSSHSGEPVHEQTVLGLLGRIGLDEGSLACGPQLPFDAAAANARIAARLPPRRIDNNCSGKHAGMLAACVVNGWPIEGYERRDHPMQRAVASAMGRYLGMDLDAAPSGVDGCGLPTYGVPLAAIARGFAAAQSDPSFGRAQDAMAAHPLLVGGHGRFDTELLTVAGSRVTVKTGGAAVWAACLRDGGLGVAVKVESGTDSGLAPVALAVLRRLGVTWPAEALAPFEEPPLQNWEGLVVGSTRVEADNLAAAFDSGGATS